MRCGAIFLGRMLLFRVVRSFVVVLPVAAWLVCCRQELDLGGGDSDASSLPDTSADSAQLASDASEGDAGSADATPKPSGTCEQVCVRAAVCGLLDDMDAAGCLPQCQSSATPAQIECMIQAPCASFLACVGAAPDTVQKCQSRCDSMSFFSCIDATELSTCRARCVSASAALRDSFLGCGSASQCPQARDCFSVFTR